MTTSTPPVEKPFVCPQEGCGKAFLRPEHLTRHRQNHQPDKVYTCRECLKQFVRSDLYQRHKVRHDKGMWLRRNGGVLEKSAQRSLEEQKQSKDTLREVSSIPVQHISVPKDPLPPNFEAPSSRIRDNVPEVPQYDGSSDHGLGMRNGHGMTDSNRGQGISYDALFFDDSANIQDLPDDLDWFFENTQPDLMAMDLETSFAPTETFESHEAGAILSLPSYHQQSASPSTSTYESTWSIACSNILASLHSLPPDLLESPFFHPPNLAMFYDLYFKNYHHHFPILHRPSLSITEAPPLLLTAILTLGATLAPDPAFFYIGQRIHDALRWIIFATGEFEPPSPLWCLQALLLVQAQGKMFSTAKHHEMAHIFHGAILTMMKRGRAYSTISSFSNTQSASLEVSWRQWAEDESSRRTAFFAFIQDAQHASLFGHNPVLSVSDMRLPLPCTDILWECPSATQWQKLIPLCPKPPQFLPTLKALLGKNLVPAVCSDFSRFTILHGLLSLTTHLHARDNTTLGLGIRRLSPVSRAETPTTPPAVEDWKETMNTAIDSWSFCLLSLEPSLCLEAAQPLHRMAYVTLHTNLTDFHVLAKDGSGSDTSLSRKEFTKAEGRLREWSRKTESREAVNQALLLVKETVFTGKRYRARDDNIQLRPWALYHAILVLWAYGLLTEGPSDEGAVLIGAEEYVVRMLSALQRGKGAVVGASRTRGLLAAMADALEGCRWELLEEAYGTLHRLSGSRLSPNNS